METLLDQFMPEYRLRQIDRIRVKASPEVTWEIARNLDTFELPISKFLFTVRTLPEIFMGKKRELPKQSKIKDFTGPDKGFKILAENIGREIVIGSIGKFWKLNIPFQNNISSSDFVSFTQPGFGKLVWNLKVDPDAHGGSWLTWELRVTATNDETWKQFKKYWFVIGKFSHMIRRMALKLFETKLGAVDEESLALDGDDKIAKPLFQKTMSVTIEKSPHNIWPWLVQMGRRRAGWYSIDQLDNGGIESAREIKPNLQDIKVGDVLPVVPDGKIGFLVLGIKSESALILGSPPADEKGKQLPFSDTWAFVLEPIGSEATRLITRVRAEYEPSFKMQIFKIWMSLVHYIMEKAQLINLKKRVEDRASGLATAT